MPPPTVRDVLLGIRALFEPGPETWTKLASARDQYGIPVRSTEPAAICWCLGGAIAKVIADLNPVPDVGGLYLETANALVAQQARPSIGRSVSGWNDRFDRTYGDVMDLVNRTIEVS